MYICTLLCFTTFPFISAFLFFPLSSSFLTQVTTKLYRWSEHLRPRVPFSRDTRSALFLSLQHSFSFTRESLNYVFHADSVANNSQCFFFFLLFLEQRTRDASRTKTRPPCAAREHELTRRVETSRGRSASFTEPLFGRFTAAPPPGLHPYRPFSSIASFPFLIEISASIAIRSVLRSSHVFLP